MSDLAGEAPGLTVSTSAVADISPLIPLVDPRHPLVFIRRGQGIAGVGEALRLEFTGARRMRDAAEAWKEVVSAATVEDPIGVPGSGLVALGSFAFSDSSPDTSVLIVPSLVIGRRDGVSWVTRIGTDAAPTATPYGEEFRLSLQPGALDGASFVAAVEIAVARLNAGELSKVVLARDLVGHLPAAADVRLILASLALGYPDTWTYAVDGLIGSSPETLVSVQRGTVSARVLAGSIGRGTDAAADQDLATELATSAKDLDEHRYAVQSVLTSLRPHSPTVATSDQPFLLKLPNLWHLASDVEGPLHDGSNSLDLIAALHPTAAVAGTPTAAALRIIQELEPSDRGRYAGPVGWVGANGDGEWAIALRGAQIAANGDVRAFAGAGIVADSIPEHELAETKLKFRPIVEAFA